MLTVTHLKIEYTLPAAASQHTRESIRYAVEAYAFLLKNGTYTYRQFARIIAQHYSIENPRNLVVVNTLKEQSQRASTHFPESQ